MKNKKLVIIIVLALLVLIGFAALKGWITLPGTGSGLPELTGPGASQTSSQESSQASQEESPSQESSSQESSQTSQSEAAIAEDGEYVSRDEVALYLHTYGRLPRNFITKSQAQQLGWVSSEGNLWEVAAGKSIGGDRFGNREGGLPDKEGRQWYECDVNYRGGYRDAERILYSDDGLIYYTDDHYASFTRLY